MQRPVEPPKKIVLPLPSFAGTEETALPGIPAVDAKRPVKHRLEANHVC